MLPPRGHWRQLECTGNANEAEPLATGALPFPAKSGPPGPTAHPPSFRPRCPRAPFCSCRPPAGRGGVCREAQRSEPKRPRRVPGRTGSEPTYGKDLTRFRKKPPPPPPPPPPPHWRARARLRAVEKPGGAGRPPVMEPAAEEAVAAARAMDNGARIDTSELFTKIAALLEAELNQGSDDFTLVEQMNLLTTQKYREMAQYTSGLVAIMDKLREKKAQLQPSLDAIDRVDQSVTELERIAGFLDEYTKELEAKLNEAM
eukprot:SAG22_NODE_797_length_7135_cov_211.841103_9_plen_258_part_00